MSGSGFCGSSAASWLVVATIVVFTGEATACGVAYQQRIFPLGTVGGRIAAVRLHVSRSGSLRLVAKQSASLVLLDAKGRLHSVLRKARPVVDAEIAALTQKWYRALSRRKGFQPLKPLWAMDCAFSTRCGPVEVRHVKGRVPILIWSGPIRSATLPIRFSRHFRDHLKAFWSGAEISGLAPYLGSVRLFASGDNTRLLVVHLATGTLHLSRGPSWKPGRLRSTACRTAPSCLPSQMMMHHGNGFDLVIWLSASTSLIPKGPSDVAHSGCRRATDC
ncbi:MAG: hypothetical protein KC609_01995 [Myxococcales bacterium]|nr:hypothetical protein [Myxococcales bacterium]